MKRRKKTGPYSYRLREVPGTGTFDYSVHFRDQCLMTGTRVGERADVEKAVQKTVERLNGAIKNWNTIDTRADK